MSDQEHRIAHLEHRVSLIETDEIKSVKKMYDHSRWLIGIFIGSFSIIIAIQAAYQLIAFSDERQRIREFVQESSAKINKFTGEVLIDDYRLEYFENDLQKINLFYSEMATSKIGDTPIFRIQFVGQAQLFGVGEGFGRIAGMQIRYDINSAVIFTTLPTDFERQQYRELNTSNQQRHFEAHVNDSISAQMAFTVTGIFDSCNQYSDFISSLDKEHDHGSLYFTPIILNQNGITREKVIPFSLVLPDSPPNCPLDDEGEIERRSEQLIDNRGLEPEPLR